jgi:glutamate-1-semialdehyde 2,1-aminomutase
MNHLAPSGAVYQAGTLSGNPLSTAAGIATLKVLGKTAYYRQLEQYAVDLTGRLIDLFAAYRQPMRINRVESLFTLFFASYDVVDFQSAQGSDMSRYAEFFHRLLRQGVFVAPSGYEAWFVSTAHTNEQLDQTVAAAELFLQESPQT